MRSAFLFGLAGVFWRSSDFGLLWWVVGVGWVVERFAFVVIAQATDNSGAVPGLDGVPADAEQVRHLGGGEHAGCAQALAAAAQPVGVNDVVHDLAVEGLPGASGQAALVEDVGDLTADVFVE
jgi:hypothetical protein